MTDVRAERAAVAIRRRFEARDLIDRLKSGPCKDCGRKFRPCQMDFWRDSESIVQVSKRLLMSKDRIVEEVAKCVLVCANCHRLRTWNRDRERRSGPT